MRFRSGHIHWYDFILIGLAAAIVYPDKILEWVSERTGKSYGLLALLVVEAIAISLTIVAMVLLMPAYPKLLWWQPLLFVGCVALFRVLMWLVMQMFGFDD